ncbi:MAG: PP2C family serine/threonine-protein phosphatase [Treponemataceae bacterium]
MIVFFCISSFYAQEFFWEYPEAVSNQESYFPASASNGKLSIVIWQQVSWINEREGTISINWQTSNDASWKAHTNTLGPFLFSGEVPSISSVAINSKNIISIAILTSPDTISIFSSNDDGNSFTETAIQDSVKTFIAPRIYVTSKDNFFLFVSQDNDANFLLFTATSEDGKEWTPFSLFSPSEKLTRSFVPVLSPFGDKDIVVFQSIFAAGFRISYQLHSTISKDGGKTWADSTLITDQTSIEFDYKNYHSQNPDLFYFKGNLYLAWERSYISSENAQIYFSQLSNEGKLVGLTEQISSGRGGCSNPIIFPAHDNIAILWFDSRRGKNANSVYLATRQGLFWTEQRITTSNTDSTFSLPVLHNNFLHYFWIQQSPKSKQVLMRLSPDIKALPPTIKPLNFVAGKKSVSEKVSVQVDFPDDSSGFAGYAYSWSRTDEDQPDTSKVYSATEPIINQFAVDDETLWYLKVRAVDKAGNWSKPSSITYRRDITPPLPPIITPALLDDKGFVSNSSFNLDWQAALEDDDVEGFSFSLQYMAPLSYTKDENLLAAFTPKLPPQGNITKTTRHRIENLEDGIWAFSVSAIDEVGNISQPAIIRLFLNKFVPYTIITKIYKTVDPLGVTTISIEGKGFLTNGLIDYIYFSKKGQDDYEYILSHENGDYKIRSDRLIDSIILKDFDANDYSITLNHQTRGLYFSLNPIDVKDFGTVKFGLFDAEYIPNITKFISHFIFSLNVKDIFLLLIFIIAIIGIVLALRGLISIAKNNESIKHELFSFMTGDTMAKNPKEKNDVLQKISHRGQSLRFKIMFLTSILVIMIVLLVSISLGYIMIKSQEETLAKGLKDRVSVLLDGVSSGVRAHLPSQNILELSFLPQQSQAIEEAFFVTITGLPSDGNNINLNYIWATNDENINEKIDSKTLVFGESYLNDQTMHAINNKALALNMQAIDTAGYFSKEIDMLTKEGITLALQTDQASVERREEIQTVTRQLNNRIIAELARLSKQGFSSLPAFDGTSFDRKNTNYTFYQPVLYRQGAEQNFVRGIVMVSVSTEALIKQLDVARDQIIITGAIIAIIATVIGAVISLIIASIIIIPIKKLANHVALIRDTEDKEELAAYTINFKSRDEIGLLGEIVNDMTQGLVRASAAAKDLTVGKEIQKMFIPLETDSQGKKLTTGKLVTQNAEFFGYYEGAKGVSGDYFDFKKLDDRHYAVIKCDVAGKGVPASLIMVEVATLFLDYFKDWSIKTHGYNLTAFVSRVNDMLESRGFQGRFAAFSLCIFDSFTGDIHFCNAGDNFLHFYNATARKKVVEHIKETAAAGVFPTSLVDLSGGYQMITRHLTKNDVLFMYTDGIEEAKRLFRNEKFENITCEEPGYKPNTTHESHLVGEASEEMGADRVNAIIESVFAKGIYTLKKWHNPVEETFEFDFRSCAGTVEDCIMALVSVEKIFRLYKTPNVTKHDRVLVDRKIDIFLRKHFRQYSEYCKHKQDHSEMAEYMWYTHMLEDPQYDDLTLLGIRKI